MRYRAMRSRPYILLVRSWYIVTDSRGRGVCRVSARQAGNKHMIHCCCFPLVVFLLATTWSDLECDLQQSFDSILQRDDMISQDLVSGAGLIESV